MTTLADDSIAKYIRDVLKLPVDRETYILVNWMGDPPVNWTAEDEDQLPEELQDWSWFWDEVPAFEEVEQGAPQPARDWLKRVGRRIVIHRD
jgi:hypothetical protein